MGLNRNSLPYGLGALGLGVLGFATGDFALQWQPVPAGIALRPELAWLSAGLLALGALAAIWRRTSAPGRLGLGLMYGVWVVALHMPTALAKASEVASWNAVAEALALSLGGFVGWAAIRRPNLAPMGRRLFGLCPVIFALAHFGYAKFTASMVPAWLPAPLFWAGFTGACHLAGGLALIAGVVPRLAATLLALMYGGFALILHLPRVIAAPDQRIEWTMLFIAVSLAGAAWLVRPPPGEGRQARASGREAPRRGGLDIQRTPEAGLQVLASVVVGPHLQDRAGAADELDAGGREHLILPVLGRAVGQGRRRDHQYGHGPAFLGARLRAAQTIASWPFPPPDRHCSVPD